tara:strand:+ start:10302 stop:10826 length:525 start_codon:yes stop_codon:yes gene_type:complete
MYQTALNLFCVSLIVLICFWLASCGMLPNATNPTLEFSKGDKIEGGGQGTQGVGEGKLDLNFSDNNSKNYERSTLKNKDTSNQLKASQDKTIFSIGGEHTDLSKRTLKTDTRSNTADDYVKGDQNNNVFNIGIKRLDLLLMMLFAFLIPSPLSPIYRAIKKKIISWIDDRKSRN